MLIRLIIIGLSKIGITITGFGIAVLCAFFIAQYVCERELTRRGQLAEAHAMGDVTFAIPYLQLAVLLAGTVLASLAATIAPALSATRIRPAVALRMTD